MEMMIIIYFEILLPTQMRYLISLNFYKNNVKYTYSSLIKIGILGTIIVAKTEKQSPKVINGIIDNIHS